MTKLIYFGSPKFSAKILESVITDLSTTVQVVGVVTNPDTPKGRTKEPSPTPVAQLAQSHHLPLFKPQKLDDGNLTHIKLLNPEIFLVVSYGKIIPPSWLKAPAKKTLNLHFSLLPKYRGALCIQEAIKNQDTQTGVTLMEMDEEMDHGPIIATATEPIGVNDTVADLTENLTTKAIALLNDTLPDYLAGKLSSTPQDHTKATFTPSYKSLTHDAAYIPWTDVLGAKPAKIHAKIRSLNPDPGAWTVIPTVSKNVEAKILKTSLDQDKLVIETLQLPGKAKITWKQFLAGHSLK